MQRMLDLPLRTERLRLRTVVADDAAALLAYRSRPDVARYVPFAPMDAAVIERRLAGGWTQAGTLAEAGDSVLIGIERQDTGQLIGDVTLFLRSVEHRGGEIGWLLHPDHSGWGYATEAAHGVLHLAFDARGLNLHRVVARVDARNAPSLALCERLGMRREALLRENEWFKGEWTDEVDYALLADEWAAAHTVGASASCRWP
jgi:RimJ/RimL family protein N-acetyltransferase